MKKKWIISADSGFDLPKEIIEKYDIRISNIWITLGEETKKDNEFTQDELYEFANRTGTLPKTGALSPLVYEEWFASLSEEAENVIHISLSSGISSSNQNAAVAAEAFDNVFVIDSLNLSSGFGQIVLLTAELLESGKEVKDVVSEVEKTLPLMDSSFVLDSLEYMKMGGRCSSIAVLGANLLKLKPCIEVKEGKLGMCKKYRGKFEDVLITYVDDRLADVESINPKRCFITHAGVSPEVEKKIYDYVCSKGIFEEVLISRASCTISTHCGKDTLGLLFFRK